MRYTYDTVTGLYTGFTSENLPDSTDKVPYLQNERNTMRYVNDDWLEITINRNVTYRYNIGGKLVTVNFRMPELQELAMTDEEAKHCIGFDQNGTPLYDQEAIQAEIDRAKKQQIATINSNFDAHCKKLGTLFEGHYFQYDDVSRSRLQEVKDDARVTYWRSVDNVNVPLTNVQKNELYEELKVTYYTKFAEKSALIDSL